MTQVDDIVEILAAVFSENFHIEMPAADVDLLENAILDSFQLVELLFQVERRSGVKIAIDEVDLDDLRTVGRLARLLAGSAADARPALQSTG
ncbi:MAG TPA: phosphopantetheine-binding protein [Steroidobacteraceae bacterium]|nr:phosphopantetheine-binding protein [Steroidobacteraceae bacterium]